MTEKITSIKSGGESVRFIGNWHESIPRILFMDPFMHAQDRNVYCVIRALMSEEGIAPNREMRFSDSYRDEEKLPCTESVHGSL